MRRRLHQSVRHALRKELDDSYLASVEEHLTRLRFRDGVLVSARLSEGNLGIGYVLRKPNEGGRPWGRPWLQRLLAGGPAAYTFRIHERDEGGGRSLSELRDRGINHVANAVTQSTEHILRFFRMLQTELAFYVGCLNLSDRLAAADEPVCFPTPAACAERRYRVRGLYDLCLALSSGHKVVGNDRDGDGSEIFMITGANEGGKSTFLRSVGVSQLMMQCGIFVAAPSYSANLCAGIFTHYKREEDATMRAGKFEEELQRISGVVDHLAPDCLVLFNASFQSTNEREGSEIGSQIVRALLESRVKIFFVTHMYDLALRFCPQPVGKPTFFRGGRRDDGTRTFRLLSSSHDAAAAEPGDAAPAAAAERL